MNNISRYQSSGFFFRIAAMFIYIQQHNHAAENHYQVKIMTTPIIILPAANGLTFSKTTLDLGGIIVDTFKQTDSKNFRYSQTSLAGAIGKTHDSAAKVLQSKGFKAIYSEPFSTVKVAKDGGGYYSLIDSKVALAYFMYWCSKGNPTAVQIVMALAAESLDIRAARAFNELTPEVIQERLAETESYIQRWMDTRKFSKSIHTSFSTAAYHKKHPANLVHDKITELVNGMTAAEARQGQLVDDKLDPTIGLNYVGNINKLQIIALAKMEYAGLRAGGWEQQAERAVKIAMREIKAALANR